ncbi:MAG: D-cysteine desulfhydrase family protein [Acidobacteria bacterium]|nr:D-cysteine desulfhydrase family protein [Acidobacteriota bacterium]
MNFSPGSLGRLGVLPRAEFVPTPTSVEEMKNLTAHLAGARMFVKRDDAIGLAMGGNKARQLEFYLGDAIAQSADTILITGAVQSNYVRMAAAAARKMRMDIHIQLEERVSDNDRAYRESGNVLLDRMLGATLYSYPKGEDEAGADARLEDLAADLRRKGRRPYVIHLGLGHPPLGALGYVRAAHELLEQAHAAGLQFDEIVVASGSGHTHAGLLFGLRALGCRVHVTGACVRRSRRPQIERISDHCGRIATILGVPNPVGDFDIALTDDFLAPGYGQLNASTVDAIKLAARTEALLLDPVYTGKAMAAAIDRARAMDREQQLLFVHTGGGPGIFGYAALLNKVL